jgi:hypothetical protein
MAAEFPRKSDTQVGESPTTSVRGQRRDGIQEFRLRGHRAHTDEVLAARFQKRLAPAEADLLDGFQPFREESNTD